MQDDIIGRAKLKLFDQDSFKILNLCIYAETNIWALRDRKKLKKTQDRNPDICYSRDIYLFSMIENKRKHFNGANSLFQVTLTKQNQQEILRSFQKSCSCYVKKLREQR